MNPPILAMLIPIFAIVGFFVMIVFLRYYENMERMALIEKGLDPFVNKPRQRLNPSVTLLLALLAIGAGLGILLGNILQHTLDIVGAVAVFSMLLIFGGLGLLASYAVELRMARKEKEEAKASASRYENS